MITKLGKGPASLKGKRVAVMQPYFFPYAGYFRLMHVVDHFLIFDCVQFARRGRVHRTEIAGPRGEAEWLTLPLEKQQRDVAIKDLAFVVDARARLDVRLARYPWLANNHNEAGERLHAYLYGPLNSVIDYLETGLRLITELLGFDPIISRSSALGLSPALRSQDRVIAAVKAVDGVHYINSPGGRDLYDPARFAKEELTLSFLSPYRGPYFHFLSALMCEPHAGITANIRATSILEP